MHAQQSPLISNVKKVSCYVIESEISSSFLGLVTKKKKLASLLLRLKIHQRKNNVSSPFRGLEEFPIPT